MCYYNFHCVVFILPNYSVKMSDSGNIVNIYTCSQADLESFSGIGPQSAGDIIAIRNEVLEGKRQPLNIQDLAKIRLKPEKWQEFIDRMWLSITLPAKFDRQLRTQTGVSTQAPMQDVAMPPFGQGSNVLPTQSGEAPLTPRQGQIRPPQQTPLGQTPLQQHQIPFQGQRPQGQTPQNVPMYQVQTSTPLQQPQNLPVTQELQFQTMSPQQAQGFTPDPIVRPKQLESKSTKQLMQDTIVLLASRIDETDTKILSIGTSLTGQIANLTRNVENIHQVNLSMQSNLQFLNSQNTDIQAQLSSHDEFLQKMSNLLTPAIPVSANLPLFSEGAIVQTPGQSFGYPETPASQGMSTNLGLTPPTNIQKPTIGQTMTAHNNILPNTAMTVQQTTITQPTYTYQQPHPTPYVLVPQSISTQTSRTSMADIKPKTSQESIIDKNSNAIPRSAVYGSVNQAPPVTNKQMSTSNSRPPPPSIQTTAAQQLTSTSQNIQSTHTTQLPMTDPVHTSQTDDAVTSENTVVTNTNDRRRPRTKTMSKTPSTSRSKSLAPPKLQLFSGDPVGLSWTSFIMKFDRIAQRREWSESKKLDRLIDCLTDKALEYASRSENKENFTDLKNELKLRFDYKEEPIAVRQRLHLARQDKDETLEAFLQRILGIAMDGYKDEKSSIWQQLATDAFLRGCKNKDAAMIVMNEGPKSVHEACKRVKTIMANKKAIGGKVTFQEKAFSIQEETRVSNVEKKVEDLTQLIKNSPVFNRPSSRFPSRYPSNTQG